jgi:hypothetical protein
MPSFGYQKIEDCSSKIATHQVEHPGTPLVSVIMQDASCYRLVNIFRITDATKRSIKHLMKILNVLTYYRPHTSGLTIYVEQLARTLVRRGHQVTVLTSQYENAPI